MQIDITQENNTTIVKPQGKLDTINAPDFTNKLLEIMSKEEKSLCIDMSAISFLSSSGLQSLLAGAKTAQKNATTFTLFGMNEMLYDVFSISGFNQFIPHYHTKEEALK